MTGKQISHYRILERLGGGGMGVVYKARDTRLNRFVALKFLPSHLVGSETEKARFLKEAKAAATLNHPNVCTIHEIQHSGEPAQKTADKQPFIAMEYVEGQSLRELIVGTRHAMSLLPIDEFIQIAIRIAEALKEAHRAGNILPLKIYFSSIHN